MITPETVRRIAQLANLRLSDAEVDHFVPQLEKILEYVHKLNQVSTAGVSQTSHVLPLHNVWREDRVVPGLERDAALAAAPDVKDDCFHVPRIID